METMETQVKNVIEKIRPYIQRDGGDVEFVSLEDGIVTVKMLGACYHEPTRLSVPASYDLLPEYKSLLP